MFFSLNSLRYFANIPARIQDHQILNTLNNLGFEIESTAPFAEGEGIIIGRIIKVAKHENANRLFVLQVDVGDRTLQIITSAINVAVNKQVLVCPHGSKTKTIKIRNTKMRGVKSEGMLASLDELGVDPHLMHDSLYDGIQILDTNLPLGGNALELLNLKDTIIEISILPNRADAQSYLGLAKELSAYFNTTWKITNESKPFHFKSNLKVKNGDSKHISVIEAKNIEDQTPFDEQLLLMKSGVKPQHRAIDLANLTLIVIGQPVSVYDRDQVGNNITSKVISGPLNLAKNQKLKLDQNLVVMSDNLPIALAGVKVCQTNEITTQTKNFLFEISNFNFYDIRKTLSNLKVNTLNANRNNKEVSLALIELAANFLQSKLKNFSDVINPYKFTYSEIECDPETINQYAGFQITNHLNYPSTLTTLAQSGYKVLNNTFSPPFYRYDVINQFDVIEDIFRFFGYNNFPELQPLIVPVKTGEKNLNLYKQFLVAQKYTEILSYSLKPADYNHFNPFAIKKEVEVQNPFSLKHQFYRKTIVRSLIEIAQDNVKNKNDRFSFFEIGYINGDHHMVNLALTSSIKSFSELKEDLITIFGNQNPLTFVRSEEILLHRNVSADIYQNNKKIGFIGKINQKIVDFPFWIAEIKLFSNHDNVSEFTTYHNGPLKVRQWTVITNDGEDIKPYIAKLKSQVDIFSLVHITTYPKPNQKQAVTFKLYLDSKSAKIFDSLV